MSRSERSAEDRITARAVAIEEIPLVDFTPFRTGGEAGKARVAAEIRDACETIGFFYLAGHGVDRDVIEDAFAAAADFYACPLDERMGAAATPDWYRGYIPIPPLPPGMQLTRNSRLYERYRLQLEWPADGLTEKAHEPIFDRPNRWPAGMPAFREAGEAYLAAMLGLQGELAHAFALALELPEDRFDAFFRAPPSQLELLHYPPLPEGVDPEISNIVSHTDESPFTILAQDPVGGLEVKRLDGVWISAPPIAGAFTINIGDMMMWWSNGRFISNYHRVRNRAGVERYSIPYFANPDRDVVVAPLPELVGPDETPAYPPVRVADHFARFYARLETNPNVLYK